MGHINLKLDDKLHETIRQLATHNRRSVTQEINYLLARATTPTPHSLTWMGDGSAANRETLSSVMEDEISAFIKAITTNDIVMVKRKG